jgi:hypothetical protein
MVDKIIDNQHAHESVVFTDQNNGMRLFHPVSLSDRGAQVGLSLALARSPVILA